MFGSILELAITLTITSTILISSLLLHDYVERSRLYSFIVEIDDIKKRVNLFQYSYNFLPGDFPFASKLWQQKCSDLAMSSNVDCDGDGDFYINNLEEGFLALKHLSFTNYYNWNNKKDYISSYAKSFSNVGRSKFINSDFQVLGDTKLHIVNYNIEHLGRNFLRFAQARDKGNILDSILSPRDSQFIDSKIDDGLPLSGKLIADMGSKEFENAKEQLCLKNLEKNIFFYRKFETNIYCYIQVSLEK